MIYLREKCEQYLKFSGHTIYTLAKTSGLDRLTLHRLIKGTHLPTPEFLSKFCDSLRINHAERQTLFDLYEKAADGPAAYNSRKYISSMLATITEEERRIPFPFSSSRSFHSFIAENTEFPVQTQIQTFDFLEHIFCMEQESALYTNFPFLLSFSIPELMLQLHIKYPSHCKIHLHHLLEFSSNPLLQPDTNCNLKILQQSLPLVFSGFQEYLPSYLYNHGTQGDSFQLPWPYYLITDTAALIFSADGSKSIFQDDPAFVSLYKKEMQKMLQKSKPLFAFSNSSKEAFALYERISDPLGYLSAQPCLAHCIGDLPGIDTRLLLNQLYSPNPPSFFTFYGLYHFWNTGKISGQFASCLPPLSLEQRKEVLLKFLKENDGTSSESFLLKNTQDFPLNLCIERLRDGQLLLCQFQEKMQIRFLLVQESSIYEAFADFFHYLQSPSNSYSLQETNQFIRDLITDPLPAK